MLLDCIPKLYQKCFMLSEEAVYNGWSLDLSNPFNFQVIAYSEPLSAFKFHILNVGW